MKTFETTLPGRPAAKLTGYLQARSEEMSVANIRPAVLIFPGGAYKMTSDREAEPVALAYMAHGFDAFILRYTVGESIEFGEALADADAAMAYITENAAAWGVDAARLAVVGFSAGGHLAAAVGTMGKLRPAALVLCYPCILQSISPILACTVPGLDERVDGDTPPAFLFATQNDELVPVENTLAFAAALQRAGIGYELHVFSDGIHGLSLAGRTSWAGNPGMLNPRAAAWHAMSVEWLASLGQGV